MDETVSKPYGLIDLHLHLDGSLSPSIARRLAELGSRPLELDEKALLSRLQVSPACRDLNEYLACFDFPIQLLQTPLQVSEAVFLLQEELRSRGLLYAELRFAPQLFTRSGMSQEEVVEAALEGLSRSDFHAQVVLCAMRGESNMDQNEETFRIAARHLSDGVCGVDLAGAEALWPTSNYAGLFSLARKLGLPFTIHAGEASGPVSVLDALNMGAVRIGHGVRSVEDPALVERLAAAGVTLEICPTSNINTRVYGSYDLCPVMRLHDAGVKVCLASDNMAVSGTDVRREHALVGRALGMDERDHLALDLAAAEAAFVSPDDRRTLAARVREAYAAAALDAPAPSLEG
ncbi:adenosine deaminase [Tractidigestivibacter scatoligenes]|jgi:adenosine deaminase|uniref:adenosine deaminase n=1 Tax=Tractidigestivibacter scatoligenes TaxID=1299998 RepID=UPI002F35DFD7